MLGWSYCVQVLCVSYTFLLCAPQSLVPRRPGLRTVYICTGLRTFRDSQALVLLCVRLWSHRMSQSLWRAETCPQGFSFAVLVCLDYGARLPGVKPQPCPLLLASGLLLKL